MNKKKTTKGIIQQGCVVVKVNFKSNIANFDGKKHAHQISKYKNISYFVHSIIINFFYCNL